MADREEYERVANELLPMLYKMAMGILHNDADARDAVQQALLKGWEKKEAAKPGMFKWYLNRILINECRNIQRRRMRVFPVEQFPDAAVTPPDYRDLYDAIRTLPEELRLPLLLKYLQGASEKEGAMALSIPVTTFKNRLHRARKALRKLLDREVMFE
ncbi:MAG: RNA polymerase sigma factor [Clostridiales bacterium]|nr:RNA polymerase sigma factor [Clostridiales bacterium]